LPYDANTAFLGLESQSVLEYACEELQHGGYERIAFIGLGGSMTGTIPHGSLIVVRRRIEGVDEAIGKPCLMGLYNEYITCHFLTLHKGNFYSVNAFGHIDGRVRRVYGVVEALVGYDEITNMTPLETALTAELGEDEMRRAVLRDYTPPEAEVYA
jgi:hypothetical protein